MTIGLLLSPWTSVFSANLKWGLRCPHYFGNRNFDSSGTREPTSDLHGSLSTPKSQNALNYSTSCHHPYRKREPATYIFRIEKLPGHNVEVESGIGRGGYFGTGEKVQSGRWKTKVAKNRYRCILLGVLSVEMEPHWHSVDENHEIGKYKLEHRYYTLRVKRFAVRRPWTSPPSSKNGHWHRSVVICLFIALATAMHT